MKRKPGSAERANGARSAPPTKKGASCVRFDKVLRGFVLIVVTVLVVVACLGSSGAASRRPLEEGSPVVERVESVVGNVVKEPRHVLPLDERLRDRPVVGRVVVGLVEEHHHVLPYYERLRDTRTDGPYTILHLDSHADMGVPNAPGDDRVGLERFAAINDFLTLAAYEGLADHLIFVEPPWSNQFRCCVYADHGTFEFVAGVDAAGDVYVDVVGETARRRPRETFGHIFWRNGERRVKPAAQLCGLRYFNVSVVAAESTNLAAVLTAWLAPGPPTKTKKPWILDVDLDFWATVSPGAEQLVTRTLRDTALGYEALGLLYHLMWDFPDLGRAYFAQGLGPRLREDGSALDFVRRVDDWLQQHHRPEAAPRAGEWIQQTPLARTLETIAADRDRRGDQLRAIVALAATADVDLDDADVDGLYAFFEQPYHAPPLKDLRAELYASLANTWQPILRALEDPVLINVIRSPGYVPKYLLSHLECEVLDHLHRVYAFGAVAHEPRVDPRRTRCPQPPSFEYTELPLRRPRPSSKKHHHLAT